MAFGKKSLDNWDPIEHAWGERKKTKYSLSDSINKISKVLKEQKEKELDILKVKDEQLGHIINELLTKYQKLKGNEQQIESELLIIKTQYTESKTKTEDLNKKGSLVHETINQLKDKSSILNQQAQQTDDGSYEFQQLESEYLEIQSDLKDNQTLFNEIETIFNDEQIKFKELEEQGQLLQSKLKLLLQEIDYVFSKGTENQQVKEKNNYELKEIQKEYDSMSYWGDGLDIKYHEAIQEYTFGGDDRTHAISSLLQTAKIKGIAVYILTNGNPDGVWATLNIMSANDLVSGVYGCGIDFRYSKYNCISKIMKKHGLPCNSEDDTKLGYLFDDQASNKDNGKLCPTIKFIHLNGYDVSKTDDYTGNIFYDELVKVHVSEEEDDSDCLAMTVEQLNTLETEIGDSDSNIKILFFDWDCTLQPHHGPVPLEEVDIINSKMETDNYPFRLLKL